MSAQLPAPRLADPGWDREPKTAAPRRPRRRPLATSAAALSAPVAGLIALAALASLAGTGGPGLDSLPGSDGLAGSSATALVKDTEKAKREKSWDAEERRPSSEPKPEKDTEKTAEAKPEPAPDSGGTELRDGPPAHAGPAPSTPEETDDGYTPPPDDGYEADGPGQSAGP